MKIQRILLEGGISPISPGSGRWDVFPHLNRPVKDKSVVDKIIVEKQPYQLLNTNREFFPSFDASNFHNVVDESS